MTFTDRAVTSTGLAVTFLTMLVFAGDPPSAAAQSLFDFPDGVRRLVQTLQSGDDKTFPVLTRSFVST